MVLTFISKYTQKCLGSVLSEMVQRETFLKIDRYRWKADDKSIIVCQEFCEPIYQSTDTVQIIINACGMKETHYNDI
jgi:hypothetical protein